MKLERFAVTTPRDKLPEAGGQYSRMNVYSSLTQDTGGWNGTAGKMYTQQEWSYDSRTEIGAKCKDRFYLAASAQDS